MLDIRKIKNGYWWDAQGKFESLVANEESLKEITVQITDRCNMNCIKCNKTNFTNTDISVGKVVLIIEQAFDAGLKHIHFTGGEPTLHPHYPFILQLCRQKGLRIDMSTNGMFDEDKMYEMNGNINSINVSWDFIEKQPKCFDFISDFNIKVFLNHMVMPSNYRELPQFLEYIESNYQFIVDIQLMPPRGTADKFSKDQLEAFNDMIVPLCRKFGDRFPMVGNKLSTMLIDANADKGIYHDKIEWLCHRSKSELRVGAKGFTTCTYLYRDGHITCELDKSVKEALVMCKEECNSIPPMKDMCDYSCSPEIVNFNRNVELSLQKNSRQ